MYHHLQQKVRNAEALAQKYKQQQEALSAQLQGEWLLSVGARAPSELPSLPTSPAGAGAAQPSDQLGAFGERGLAFGFKEP